MQLLRRNRQFVIHGVMVGFLLTHVCLFVVATGMLGDVHSQWISAVVNFSAEEVPEDDRDGAENDESSSKSGPKLYAAFDIHFFTAFIQRQRHVLHGHSMRLTMPIFEITTPPPRG